MPDRLEGSASNSINFRQSPLLQYFGRDAGTQILIV